MTLFQHVFFQKIVDGALMLVGKEPQLAPIYQKLLKGQKTLRYCTEITLKWDVKNLVKLGKLLQNSGKSQRNSITWSSEWKVDFNSIEWRSYIENYCLGLKKFLLKEDMSKIKRARRRMRILQIVHYTTIAACLVMFAKVVQWIYKWRVLIINSADTADEEIRGGQ
ncbi:fatty acyl-CoA reductase 2-like [Convolutriloba macropyga]|uniref:fatty acyl-CoA reductase 2-like n=1 Tax=Convolutriloba macropyga TaxID=536237 RepID=UPI003F51F71E